MGKLAEFAQEFFGEMKQVMTKGGLERFFKGENLDSPKVTDATIAPGSGELAFKTECNTYEIKRGNGPRGIIIQRYNGSAETVNVSKRFANYMKNFSVSGIKPKLF